MERLNLFLILFIQSLAVSRGWSATKIGLRCTRLSTSTTRISRSNQSLYSSLNGNDDKNVATGTTKSRSNHNNNNHDSPWQNAIWQIEFNFGRETGSSMPEEWGEEGGRLVLSPLEVEITSDRPDYERRPEDPMLKRNAWILRPLKSRTAKYITMKGEQQAIFGKDGGWKIRMPWGGTSAGSSSSTIAKQRGHASKIMFYVDLETNIAKGDIKLQKGERIYMTGKCWREDDLENALKQMYPIRRDYLKAQQRLEAQIQHETGDRRLDGTDPIQTIMGMKDAAQLVLQRDEALRKYEDAKTIYPNFDDNDTKEYSPDDIPLEEGPWPGQLEWLSLEPGYLLVRRSSFLEEEYHIIGKWKAEPIFDEGDEGRPSIF